MNQLEAAAQHYKALKASLLEAMPDLADDPDCLLDTLEGETNVHNQIATLLRSALNDEAMLFALKDMIAKMKQRADRLATRAQHKRRNALEYMDELGIKNVMAPDMTVSRMHVPPSVVIVDEDKIPKAFMRVKYVPNKTLIGKVLREGDPVEGCLLSNAGETISIKVT